MLTVVGNLRMIELESDFKTVVIVERGRLDRQINGHKTRIDRNSILSGWKRDFLLENVLSDNLVIVHHGDKPRQGNRLSGSSGSLADHHMHAQPGSQILASARHAIAAQTAETRMRYQMIE